jgi:hypothetical protein
MLRGEVLTLVRIELQLDEQTLARACQLAASRQVSLDDLVKELIEQSRMPVVGRDPWIGLFADEPELVDQVVEMAMKDRGRCSPRQEDSG